MNRYVQLIVVFKFICRNNPIGVIRPVLNQHHAVVRLQLFGCLRTNSKDQVGTIRVHRALTNGLVLQGPAHCTGPTHEYFSCHVGDGGYS